MFKPLHSKSTKLISKYKFSLLACLVIALFFIVTWLSIAGFNLGPLHTSEMTLTSDEVSHITSGYYYLRTGRYFINPEHPPLAKVISALPLLVLNPKLPHLTGQTISSNDMEKFNSTPDFNNIPLNFETENRQWDLARVFLFESGNNPDQIALVSRTAVLIANTIFIILIYLSMRKFYGRFTALLSIILITLTPMILGHAGLVTTDVMSALLQLLAIIWFYRTLIRPKSKRILALAILFTALALLTKFNSVLLLPAFFLAGLYLLRITKHWDLKSIGKFILRFIGFVLGVMVIIVLVYIPFTINMPVAAMVEVIPNGANLLRTDILVSILNFSPLTKSLLTYIFGVVLVIGRVNFAWQTIYFLGSVYGNKGAGPLYFPLLYLFKTPVSFLILAVTAAAVYLRKRYNSLRKLLPRGMTAVMGIYGIIYLAASLVSSLQIGLRHIMPLIILMCISTAILIGKYWQQELFGLRIKFITFGCLILMVNAAVFTFPYYLSYYNLIAGGADNGYRIATDSNYDWGQDIKQLAVWVKQNNIKQIYIDAFSAVPISYYYGNAAQTFSMETDDNLPPVGSYIAVSANMLQINNYRHDAITPKHRYNELNLEPVTRVGETIFVYKLNPPQISQ